MKLSDLLKQYRAENKISQRELARRFRLGNSSVVEQIFTAFFGTKKAPRT